MKPFQHRPRTTRSRSAIRPAICLILVAALAPLSLVLAGGASAASTVNLNSAAPFAVLSGSGITDFGNTSAVSGDVGVNPITGAADALGCSQVTGTIYSNDGLGSQLCQVTNAPLLVGAKNDLTSAYNVAAGQGPGTTVATELGGQQLVAGVYSSASTTFQITQGAGPLVLNGQGDPSSVFIFEMNSAATGLTVGSSADVSLVGGAQACNVFWRLNTATIGSAASFSGSILAATSITVANGANISGRLLAQTGDVTLINDVIRVPTCGGPGGGTGGTTAPTTVCSIVSSLTTATVGQAVTFTATVAGTDPTGSVTFTDGATVLGTAALNASGEATLTISSLDPGGHTIGAYYAGDSANPACVRAFVLFAVTPSAITAVPVTPVAPTPVVTAPAPIAVAGTGVTRSTPIRRAPSAGSAPPGRVTVPLAPRSPIVPPVPVTG